MNTLQFPAIKPDEPPRLQRHSSSETDSVKLAQFLHQHPDKWLSHDLYSYRFNGGTIYFLVPGEIAACGPEEVVVQRIQQEHYGLPIELPDTAVLAQIRALYPENIEVKEN